MNKNYAPVVIYTYTRLEHLKKTVESLQNNYLAKDTCLYIVSDGPKSTGHKNQVQQVRDYVDEIAGFKEIVKVYRDKNFGVPLSVLEAQKSIINDHGKIIDLEDDNLTAANFLNFMNDALKYYEFDESIFCIAGYCPPLLTNKNHDGDFWIYYWQLSWGVGMWKSKYNKIMPLKNSYDIFKQNGLIRQINKIGGLYITDALKRDFNKQASFSDAILAARMTEMGSRCIVPTVSKIQNIGSDGSGVSSSLITEKYTTQLDQSNKTEFDFSKESLSSEALNAAAIKFYNGGCLTKLSRKLGIYHNLLTIKQSVLPSH